jgi:hypothetical protein
MGKTYKDKNRRMMDYKFRGKKSWKEKSSKNYDISDNSHEINKNNYFENNN